MDAASILDRDALLGDLRLAANYASRAGLLRDPTMLDRLQAVELDSPAQGGSMKPHALSIALNDLAQVIQPMTLADLRSGRDPFERTCQRRARRLQLLLAILALLTMGVIGYSMIALGAEKAGLQAMQQLQLAQPMQQISMLRRMAQFDNPLAKPDASSDLYRQRIGEWAAMYQSLVLVDVKMSKARKNAWTPWGALIELLREPSVDVRTQAAESSGGGASTDEPPAGTIPSQQPASAAASVQLTALSSGTAGQRPRPSGATVIAKQGDPTGDTYEALCRPNSGGAIALPDAMANNPEWLKRPQMESINDFCFQYRVLMPITGGLNLSFQNIDRVGEIPAIEHKVVVRSNWILPFFFGMLGATIFVMRNIANIRTPAMELFPMFMRITLGGVAGIVVGWFATPALPGIEATNVLSVPFALAFLTGYGIDALFSVLDRLSRVAAPNAQQPSH